jgi:hypothetical protein
MRVHCRRVQGAQALFVGGQALVVLLAELLVIRLFVSVKRESRHGNSRRVGSLIPQVYPEGEQ